MDKQKTGTLIKEARMKKTYTQQELGDLIGVSNKAVSRWENGESFPDVALLEELANALDLKIEEIVLGEFSVENNDSLVRELVRTAKIQDKERKRIQRCLFTHIPIMLWLVIVGALTLAGSSALSAPYLFVLPTLLIIGLILGETLQDVGKNESIFSSPTGKDKIPLTLIVLSGIYSFLLMYGILVMAAANKLPAFLPLDKTGPFINTQLVFIYLSNVVYIGFCFLRKTQRESEIPRTVFLSIAVAHLQLYYSNLLHRMDSWENITKNLLLYSGVYVLVMILTLIVTIFLHRHAPKRPTKDSDVS